MPLLPLLTKGMLKKLWRNSMEKNLVVKELTLNGQREALVVTAVIAVIVVIVETVEIAENHEEDVISLI